MLPAGLPFDADVALQPMAKLAQLLGPQLSREHMLPLLHNIIADSKKHARALLKALAQQLVRPSLLAAMTPGSSAAAPGQSAAADSAAAAATAAGNSAAAATADAAAASELLLPVLESLAAADCKEDTGAWGVADCLEKAYDHWLGAEQRQQRLLQLLPVSSSLHHVLPKLRRCITTLASTPNRTQQTSPQLACHACLHYAGMSCGCMYCC
jgi:hypothetical protein